MSGALPLLPTYDFMVWTGTILPLVFTTGFKISIKFYEKLSSGSRAITCAENNGLKGSLESLSAAVGRRLKIVYI
jgi:hypothetical protein